MPRITITAGGETKTVDYVTPSSAVSPFHRVGISSSRQGLNAGESHKRQACLDRHDEMAAQLGITPAAMRAASGRHVYDTSNNPVANANSVGVFANVVADDYGCVMLTTSQWSDLAGVAAGNYDATIRSFIASLAAAPIKVVWNVKHEPQNNQYTAAQESSWRQVQARMAWLVAERNDPDVHYTDCHIPGSSDTPAWDWLPELKALRPGDWQAINARTYLGMDPYPEVGFDSGVHVVQTLAKKIAGPVAYHRGRGRTGPLCLPEVGLFNWCIAHAEPYTLTAAQQAQRLHDQLWTWGQANNLAAYFYYDVADLNDADVRDSSRTLDSPAELLEYARLARGDFY